MAGQAPNPGDDHGDVPADASGSANSPPKRLRASNGTLLTVRKVLAFPSKIIGKLEGDSCDLFRVYDYFSRLHATSNNSLDVDPRVAAQLTTLTNKRWDFLHTSSMGYAYLLTPKCEDGVLQHFWAQYGSVGFPTLEQIALRLFAVPTSSAVADSV
ncbi:Ribonuclease H-like domain [Phytophthora cactorum]|nr:Ribonuclease H-like domain [Phytophthora cactorum]